MFNPSLALELAYTAVEEAMRLKAVYADVRYEAVWQEEVVIEQGRLDTADSSTDRGMGVRVLVGGAWGFSAVSEPTRHDVGVAVRRAIELARAAAILQESPVRLSEHEAQRGVFRTPVSRDPMGVPLDDKVQRLMGLDDRLRRRAGIIASKARFHARRRRKIYVSSEGSELEQDLVYTGVDFCAGASKGEDFQIRTFPGSGGLVLGRGWEMIEELPLEARADEIADDAVELLSADPCPEGPVSLLLGPAQMAEHVARGLGPLFELDRILGLGEIGFGGSFLSADDLGSHQLASPKVHLAADARQRGGAGSFGFDDEGVAAERIDILSEGRVSGYLSSRETAARVGLERSQGAMQASSWSEAPTVRPTNLLLAPGEDGDLEAMVAGTDRGVLMDGPRAFSLDASGRTFVATCEAAWAIEGGRRARPLKNPGYRGGTERFWRSCDAVGDESGWGMFGGAEWAGAGRRGSAVGVGTAAARFVDVEVGTQTPRLVSVSSAGPLPMARISPPSSRLARPRRFRGDRRVRRSDVK